MLKGKRKKVIELRQRFPSWTLQRIADEVHLTRERVRQILKSENLETQGNYEREYQRPKAAERLYGFNKNVLSGNLPRNIRK